jgi:hypothetical protein
MTSLTAEELLAGAAGTFTVSLPANVLKPGTGESPTGSAGEVVLRPLQIRDVERVSRAAKEQRVLTSVLMVQQALVSPKMTVEQVGSLSAGLVQFLLEKVNAISGLSLGEDDLDSAVKAPLAKACFVLAREFGWTPAECSELTVGQVLLYLEMLARDGKDGGA